VRDKLDLSLIDQGEIEVKNISRPVHVFRVLIDDKTAAMATPVVAIQNQSIAVRKPYYAAAMAVFFVLAAVVVWWQPWKLGFEVVGKAEMTQELPSNPSIAVLRFDNMSDDPDQKYFSDGIAKDIITDLSQLKNLAVIARNSSFTYKGTSTKA
jgi:adenylate cyclase